MISFIRGLVADTTENAVILENNGIGYEIFMTGSSIEQVSRIDGEVKIHTYFQVREDAMQLYGFLSKDDLEMFRLLLNVNGIGPKAALGVLAGLTADELRFAVLSDDIKTISKAPGIGKKTAQKLILELKDKLKLEDAFEKKLAHEQEAASVSGFLIHDGRQEAAEALIADGVDAVFTPTDNTIMTAELSIYEKFIEAGIPHYTGADSFALNGAFVGYGVDYANLGQKTADMIVDILVDGAKPSETAVETFDNGTATVNTETCEALGLDFDTVKKAFEPLCTQVNEITTAESFDDVEAK